MGNQVMKIHPSSVVSQTPHSAIIYDELVRTHFRLKTDSPILTCSQILTTQTYARGVSVVTKGEVSSVFHSISNEF